MFSSVEEVLSKLLLTGYVTERVTATVVYLAAKLNKAILLEGPPGSGKTQLAYAVAKALGTDLERLQCFAGIDERKAIGSFDEALQRLAVELRSRSGAVEWEELKRELHRESFFSAGPLLRALQSPRPCVLLVDEIDKVDHAFEAQSFKRAAACFGLGRYLYYFRGAWVDLDDKKRPRATPKLAGWATPEGWLQGLRPRQATDRDSSQSGGSVKHTNKCHGQQSENDQDQRLELTRQIEAMAEPLGRGLYRGLLKAVARAWKPGDIKELAVLEKLLTHMQAAGRGLHRMEVALDVTGSEALAGILGSLSLKSLDQVDSLETLHKIVLALEAKVGIVSQH